MIRLQVELPVDRDKSGRLIVIDERDRTVLGPFAVAGRSSSKLASANKNPTRDPRFRFGDTPTGEYAVRQILKSGTGTVFALAEFGPHSVVVLEGVSGDAATAEANGRFHFLIQGGKTSAKDRLRATAGSLRLANDDLRALVALLRKHDDVTCSIRERAGNATASRVDDDPAVDCQDPISLGSPVRVALSGRSLSRREAMLSGSAGAMTFGLSVTFVGIGSVTPARAYTRLAYGEGAAPSNGAMQQLENGTSGNQTTGQTFDNGKGPSDATPQGDNVSPPTPPAAPAEPEPAPPPEPQPPEPPPPEAPPEPPPPEPEPEPAPAPEPEPAPQPESPPPPPETEPQPASPPEPAPEAPPPPQGSTQSGPTYSAPTQAPTTYGPGDERQTPGGVNTIQGSGQPISGPGVTQGPSDTPPPPNPTPTTPRYVPNTSTAPSYPSSSPPSPPPPSAPTGAPRSLAPRSAAPSYTAPSNTAPSSSPVSTPSTPSTPTTTPPPPAPVSSPSSTPAPSAAGALTRAQAKKNVDAAYLAIGAKRKAMNALIAQRKVTTDPVQQKALDAQIAAAKHDVALAGQDFTKAKQAFDSIKK